MATLPKPTYADILQGRRLANDSPSAIARVEYREPGDVPPIERRDPSYVDYGNNLIGIHGDGNCMFRAIAFAVGDRDLGHAELRQKVCDALPTAVPVLREALGDAGFNAHVANMRQLAEWGGDPELIAASRVLGHQIFVWTDGVRTAHYGEPGEPAVHLSYENSSHYNLFIVDPEAVSAATVSASPKTAVAPSKAGGRPKKRKVFKFTKPQKRFNDAEADVAKTIDTEQPKDGETAVLTDREHTPSREAGFASPKDTVAVSKAGGRPLNPRPAGGGGAFERPPPQVFRG